MLTSAGAVKCWGDNRWGQLGDGTTTISLVPVDVVGLGSGVAEISANGNMSCALLVVGAVKCWGTGTLGNGAETNQGTTPVDVIGLGSGVAAISVGGGHACAVLEGGSLRCWGYNDAGQVGDGTTMMRLTPVEVAGLDVGVAQVSAGGQHTCAVTVEGAAQCWGINTWGQLGDGTRTPRSGPDDVVGLGSGMATITAGDTHTCAATVAGAARCWGAGAIGQLGNGPNSLPEINRTVPVDAVGLDAGVTALSAGISLQWTAVSVCVGCEGGSTTWYSMASHSCALTSSGGVSCWGWNQAGQVGDGNGEGNNRLTPVAVFGLASGVTSLSSGSGFHSCAIVAAAVRCWGLNRYGQLGDGTRNEYRGYVVPVGVTGLGSGVATIGDRCAVTEAGAAKCWGSNDSGQLGDGTTTTTSTPVDVVGLGSGVATTTAGSQHTCALLSSGGVSCWGNKYLGQTGDGGPAPTQNPLEMSATPVGVVGLGSGVSAVDAGGEHTCALLVSGGVKCWGYNGSGQLGDATTTTTSTPVDVVGLEAGVVALSAGGNYTCALLDDGAVQCWGDNGTTAATTPTQVVGPGSGIVALDLSGTHACVLLDSGGVKCWGWNQAGQLGDGTTTNSSVPVDVVGLDAGVAQVAAGGTHTCAVTVDGAAKCWGGNYGGQLGNGLHDVPGQSMPDSSTPVDVIGLASGVVAVSAGSVSCAVTNAGAAKCWGPNRSGALGIFAPFNGAVPVEVVGDWESPPPPPPPPVYSVPGAPTRVAVTRGDAQVTVSWTAPVDAGTSPMTDYAVTVRDSAGGDPVGVTGALTRAVGSTATEFAFTGLTNGIPYTFKVAAVNDVGVGPRSARSDAVTPSGPPRPDAAIARGARPFMGDDVYNTAGAWQYASGYAEVGRSLTFNIRIQNDSHIAERFTVRGQGSSRSLGVRVRYLSPNGTDITPEVKAGTYTTGKLRPGATVTIQAITTVTETMANGVGRTATAKSTIDPTLRDTVAFVTSRR